MEHSKYEIYTICYSYSSWVNCIDSDAFLNTENVENNASDPEIIRTVAAILVSKNWEKFIR